MSSIDNKTVNTIRILSAEQVEKAKSGHPGMPMGSAAMAYTLWAKHLKHNPKDLKWVDRDRFVLSAGHGSALLYSLFHLFGYGLTMEDLKNFRQFGSKTPGHPEYGHTDGVETTTGPLGQGVSTAVGMALAEEFLAKKFNKEDKKIIDHYTYAICGDGCLMEGISGEAASLAGTLGLNKLIVLYDSNNISIEGSTDLAFTEDTAKRYEAYNWNVLHVEDGNSVDEIDKAIAEAKKSDKPALIVVKTKIGYGCPAKSGKAAAHGEPLGKDNLIETKKFLGLEGVEDFTVPEDVKAHMQQIKEELAAKEAAWQITFNEYKKEYKDSYAEFEKWMNDEFILDVNEFAKEFDFTSPVATRSASYEVLNKLVKHFPNILGGSADLSPSNKTFMKDKGEFSKENRLGQNIHFGVREQSMAAIANGIAVHGGFKAFCATFLIFSDYLKSSMRLSALMKLPVTYVLTHDSIGVGEDGPTHQPIEQMATLRSIPNVTDMRPADGKETIAAWYYAATNKIGPTALALSRQNLPSYKETSAEEALKGAYILTDTEGTPDIILMASGSEVEYIYEAAKLLKEYNVKARVISMPSMKLYEKQSQEYKESLMPKKVRARLAIEAACTMPWYKYVGLDGKVIGRDEFGASAPGEILYKEFGFTTENVLQTALQVLNK